MKITVRRACRHAISDQMRFPRTHRCALKTSGRSMIPSCLCFRGMHKGRHNDFLTIPLRSLPNRTVPSCLWSSCVVRVVLSPHIFRQSPFDSIPKTVWYIFTTFSAVGYGDMFPKTVAGKIFGMLTMFLSILALALPITVIGTNFHLAYDALIGA